jgi:cell division septum initiation protein DivIVA
MEIDYAALPTLTTENRELRDQLSDLRAEFKEMKHKLLACGKSGDSLELEHKMQSVEMTKKHREKQNGLRGERNEEAWLRKAAEDSSRDIEAQLARQQKTPPKAPRVRHGDCLKDDATIVTKRQRLLVGALDELAVIIDSEGQQMEFGGEGGEDRVPELAQSFARTQGPRGKYEPFPTKVQYLAMKLISKHGISQRDSESVYSDILEALPGSECLSDDAFLKRKYFQRKLKQARIACVLANACDLARAIAHGACMGDGAADHVLKRGVCEFFSYLEQITTAEGVKKSVYLDGYLVSTGLTSEEEVGLCVEIKQVMRYVLKQAKKKMKEMYPEQYKTAKYLGEGVDEEKISFERKRVFLADGAAQKFARLLGEEKLKEIAAKYTPEQLDALEPWELEELEWFETGNCDLHNTNLAAKHADKAVRAITEERTAYAREKVEQQGSKSNGFDHRYCDSV